ncbi:isoleucyl-tRNA synthetase [Methyloceanibacter caenitepidi]|uniref:Isoleucine--tRNA ligase n=2 Tax=Methyloceanibacter caenitepidi TaxID=1384459 RepID=A0A0A8K0Y3_9HYPH|nr:isoleucyl-tRNA synthetase [Methyloceanibacter caenitepidi]
MVTKSKSGKSASKSKSAASPARKKKKTKMAGKTTSTAKQKPASKAKTAAAPKRKPAAKRPAVKKAAPKKAVTKSAKKTVTKKRTAKTAAPKKAVAKKVSAKKTMQKTVRKASPKKTVAKKTARKTSARKAVAKKTVSKKVSAKKAAAKKPSTKRTVVKKTAAKKATGKKAAPKKAVKKTAKKSVTKARVAPKAAAPKRASAPKKAAAPKKAPAKKRTTKTTTAPRKAAKPKTIAKKTEMTDTTMPPAPEAAPEPVQPQTERDWSETLFLPKTEFPMKAGLPQREPELLQRWAEMGLYGRLREKGQTQDKFVLHDGPPYANGHLHIGHALNKILKDVICRSQSMMGKDANYVPGWDCHGLPIEWKVEEEKYRSKGKAKPDFTDSEAIVAFRRECRAYAEHWLNVQRDEFKRLGIEGDWDDPYTTMNYKAESTIARELMKFAMNGLLYRGSKPVMWSVVERTALAEAEVEYQEIESPAIYVKFPIMFATDENPDPGFLQHASVVIWTTTPWTIPGNRAVSYSPSISYGLYEITQAPEDNWAKVGERLILADALAETVKNAARIEGWNRAGDVTAGMLSQVMCAHPLRDEDAYRFKVPLLAGDHVTEDAGTGFVHTAPGHGADDYNIWVESEGLLRDRGIDKTIPFTVDEAGFFTKDAPRFAGKRVVDDKGKFGDANETVIRALMDAKALLARARYRHDYPHSWRSKKPIIFRATPQWFIAMDQNFEAGESLRTRAMDAIEATRFVPPQGEKRIKGMVETRPDWVVSRQRAWGVPITVFVHKETGDVIPRGDFNASGELIDRIAAAFEAEGADAWFVEGAKERFLDGLVDDPNAWEKVGDILDVWFDSGSTHAFVLEQRPDLKWPASLYLEGSDQHRGWFQSSLLEGCGTRGRAPFDEVLTHGFVNDEDGRKMSKSLGNVVSPQDVIRQSGAEILRLWAMSSDYADDLRIGPDIIKANVDSYRRLRNTLRFLLGNLAHYRDDLTVAYDEMPELERYMLARVAELDALVREGYVVYDFKRVFHALLNFCVNDLSAFYLDIRKDALYCDPHDSLTRRAALTVMDRLFAALTAWLAPMLCFTMEEAWLSRFPNDKGSIHLRDFPDVPEEWDDAGLREKWRKVRQIRRTVTGALEVERRERRIGSSLEAAPVVFVADEGLRGALDGLDLAEIAITSGARLVAGEGPADAFRLEDAPAVAVVFARAEGRKCARSWKVLPDVGADPEFPTLSPRDAEAVRQFDRRTGQAG